MNESSFEFSAGILICRNIREMLESEIFHGRKIRFREGKGWISRVFSIRGEDADVRAIASRLEHYAKVTGNA